MRLPFAGLVVALALVLGLVGHVAAQASGGNPEAAAMKNPVAATPESIAAGQQSYQRYCRGCHGRDATGGPAKEADEIVPPNLIDDKWEHGASDGEIFNVIKNGIPPALDMAPWTERLSDPEIWNVVNYLRDLGSKK
jgi:mono/diheme cytochrome c family protein